MICQYRVIVFNHICLRLFFCRFRCLISVCLTDNSSCKLGTCMYCQVWGCRSTHTLYNFWRLSRQTIILILMHQVLGKFRINGDCIIFALLLWLYDPLRLKSNTLGSIRNSQLSLQVLHEWNWNYWYHWSPT